MPEEICLKDLGEIVQSTRENLNFFDYDEVRLSKKFKNAFQKSIEQAGNSSEFKKTTVIITNSTKQKIYAPNQWFLLASYAVPLAKEVMVYKSYSERFLDAKIEEIKSNLPFQVKDKKEIYQIMRNCDAEGEDEENRNCLIEKLKSIFITEFTALGCEENISEKNSLLSEALLSVYRLDKVLDLSWQSIPP